MHEVKLKAKLTKSTEIKEMFICRRQFCLDFICSLFDDIFYMIIQNYQWQWNDFTHEKVKRKTNKKKIRFNS